MGKLRAVHLRVLSQYWGMPVRSNGGYLEAKKGDCWGVLCSIAEAYENAQILIQRVKHHGGFYLPIRKG